MRSDITNRKALEHRGSIPLPPNNNSAIGVKNHCVDSPRSSHPTGENYLAFEPPDGGRARRMSTTNAKAARQTGVAVTVGLKNHCDVTVSLKNHCDEAQSASKTIALNQLADTVGLKNHCENDEKETDLFEFPTRKESTLIR